MPFSYTFTIRTNSSFGFMWVSFSYWLAIWSNFSWLAFTLSKKPALCAWSSNWAHLHHIALHFFHHVFYATEHVSRTTIEEWIIFKWILEPKSLKHFVSKLVHIIMMSLHHLKHIRVSCHAAKGNNAIVAFLLMLVRLYWSISVSHK